MSYRSIKRVLGESSLERKTRILFAISLLVLVTVSFLWVNRITEDLIIENTRDKARELTSAFLLREHLINTRLRDDIPGVAEADLFNPEIWDLSNTRYIAETVTLDAENPIWQTNPVKIDNPEERRIYAELAEEIRQHFSEHPATEGTEPAHVPHIYEHKFVGTSYVYYTPVVFRSDCIHCHYPTGEKQEEAESSTPPFYVLRLTLPYENSTLSPGDDEEDQPTSPKSAINRQRAVLLAVAIVTAVLSAAALYMIVRYVIVKPLKHLREVTEDVGQGKLDVRANLNTGDDFEELARSLNRMLRHLLDTQAALQNANDDLDKKVDEQAALNLKLYEMNQVKSEFLATMGHELRTPLNSIIGFSELLENGKGINDKQKRYAGNIRTSGSLLLELFNDILDLAKLEAGRMDVNPSEFRIYDLASQLCDMVRPLANSKNIQMILNADKALPLVYQDQVKVRQILTNLLSNAIKFTPDGGRIHVTAIRDGRDRLVLEVKDSGVGIAEADREIIFEKFRQGMSAKGDDTLTREVSGTGLGLSIVREICMLLGGSITLESEIGKGSTFTVRLPWNLKPGTRVDSGIARTFEEITRQQRVNFARASVSPTPPENGTTNPNQGGETADGSSAAASAMNGPIANDPAPKVPETQSGLPDQSLQDNTG